MMSSIKHFLLWYSIRGRYQAQRSENYIIMTAGELRFMGYDVDHYYKDDNHFLVMDSLAKELLWP